MLSFALLYSILWLSRPLLAWRKGKVGTSGWQGKWPEEERQQSILSNLATTDKPGAGGHTPCEARRFWEPSAGLYQAAPAPFPAAHTWSPSPARLCGFGRRPGSVSSLCSILQLAVELQWSFWLSVCPVCLMAGESQLLWIPEGVFLLLGAPVLMVQHSKIISGVIDDRVLANND